MAGDLRREDTFTKRKGRKHSHREDNHVKLNAEIGVVQPQAKKHLEPLKAVRGKETFSQEHSKRVQRC